MATAFPAQGQAPMQFMSFDGPQNSYQDNYQSQAYSAPMGGAQAVAASYGSFDDEPPLLEELGINLGAIYSKIFSVLHPLKVNSRLHADSDLSGPLLLAVVLGSLHLLTGKVHFGVILGWSVVASGMMCYVLNMLAGSSSDGGAQMDVHKAMSILGYSQLPTVVFAGISLVLPKGVLSVTLGVVFVLWSTRVCSALLVSQVPALEDMRVLVAYPCMIIFGVFNLLTVY